MKDNKLIAEFMGFHRTEKGYIVGGFGDGTFGLAEELHFHTSWDWLIPVVQKIEEECEGVPEQLLDVSFYDEVGDVHKAVVEFIKKVNQLT